MSTEDRLFSLRDEIVQLRTEVRILEEQLAYVAEVADDARLRAVVSETPLADREAREAGEEAERTRRSLHEAQARLASLEQEQDRLLERLFDESR